MSPFPLPSRDQIQKVKPSDASPKSPAPKRVHNLDMKNRSSLFVSGVSAVPTFTSKSVTVVLEGQTLLIAGDNLKVGSLNLDEGTLTLSGKVNSLRYALDAAPSTFFKRLFK